MKRYENENKGNNNMTSGMQELKVEKISKCIRLGRILIGCVMNKDAEKNPISK
jgi:hypothetical protein